MKLYTKTGDHGTSSLYNGSRKCKNNIIFNVLGDLDELNSNLALVKAFHTELIESQDIKLYSAPGAGAMFYKDQPGIDSGKYYEWFALKEYIKDIQTNIMDISTFIATPPYGYHQQIKNMEEHLEEWSKKVGFEPENYIKLEKDIDRLQEIVPPIKNFVIPSGNKLIAQIHICRSISRRCERNVVDMYLSEETESYIGIYPVIDTYISNVKIYLNRLSDYLFGLSRFVGMTLNVTEDIYSRRSLKN